RRGRWYRYEPRDLRLDAPVRSDRLSDSTRQQCAVVHVRARVDVEEELRPARQEAAGRAHQGRQGGAGLLRIESRTSEQGGDQGLRGSQGQGRDVERRRLSSMARRGEEVELCALRQGSARRPEADRRSARGQMTRERADRSALDVYVAAVSF